MYSSVTLRKILYAILLGITSALTCGGVVFFIYMGQVFGYQDLQKTSYLETRRFTEDLSNVICFLDSNAAERNNYDMSNRRIYLAEVRYLSGQDEYNWAKEEYLSLSQLVERGDYIYTTDEYGVWDVEDAQDYNDSWYDATLSDQQIRSADGFVAISHNDYVAMLLANASLNSSYTTGDSDGDEMAEGVQIKETDAGAALWEDDTISEEFSANSYIGFYDTGMYVYSPDEDIFYSTEFGWYMVPDVLYFTEEDFYSHAGFSLITCQFASLGAILRQKVGENYTAYVQADMNLQMEERNLIYYVISDGKLYTNVGVRENVTAGDYLCIQADENGKYTIESSDFHNAYLTSEYAAGLMQGLSSLKPDREFYIGINSDWFYDDIFAENAWLFEEVYPYTVPVFILSLIMFAASLALLICLCRKTRPGSGEDGKVFLNVLDRLPMELSLVATLGGVCLMVLICTDFMDLLQSFNSAYYPVRWALRLFCLFEVCYLVAVTGWLCLIRRNQNSMVRWLYLCVRKLARKISQQKNLTARTLELFILYWLCMAILILLIQGTYGFWRYAAAGGVLLLNVGTLVLLLRQARGEQNIRDVTRTLADGNLDFHPPERKWLGTEQEIIDNIDHLSYGLQKAVEKSIHDERMKAELITNVSHDIKTPLTSIINYVDLIKQEHIENEKVLHYVEVLDRKSQRLKQLTEDLVEISKITTGNIELERVPIDFGELLRQSIGEFEDKFARQQLTVIDNIKEHSYMIFADGRRTFRILENLFQNIYKYAMPGTRVYIDLYDRDGVVSLDIKNISKAPLNIDASELMERFVRGDEARTTEGSGLGLSIAQELTKLQDGSFEIYLDGDLFKVTIAFPEYVSTEMIDMEEPETEPEPEETILPAEMK